MTANQLAWLNYQESQRANVAKESEARRSNLAKEAETQRSNFEKERLEQQKIYASSADKLFPGLGLLTTESSNIASKDGGKHTGPGEQVGILSRNTSKFINNDNLHKGVDALVQRTKDKLVERVKKNKTIV